MSEKQLNQFNETMHRAGWGLEYLSKKWEWHHINGGVPIRVSMSSALSIWLDNKATPGLTPF